MIGNDLYHRTARRVMIHESGHFVFYAAIPGFPIKSVNATLLSGFVQFTKHHPPTFHRLVGLLAGLAAEKVILGTTNLYHTRRESSDIFVARNIAFSLDRSNWRAVM